MHSLNLQQKVMIMKSIAKLILLIVLAIRYSDAATCDAPNTSSGNRTKCRIYSRSTASWTTYDCGEYNDYSNGEVSKVGVLEYGHTYKGLGPISTPEECARTCEEGASPKNCYYKFTIEMYRTFGSACDLCHPTTNTSLSSDCQCVLADGVDISGKIMVNRMYPGPSIQVCIGDMVIVDVANKVSGNGLTIHWHGLFQNGWQYYDGVPFVTQCPITFGSLFRYKFQAQNAGTHFYHGHTGLHQQDGLEGAVIIRAPRKYDPSADTYDVDGFDTIMTLKDWMHPVAQDHWPGTTFRHVGQEPDNILINGRGQWFNTTTNNFTDAPLAVINVKPNLRYRIRMINMFSWVCSVQLTIQDHHLTVIASDGQDIKPIRVNTITSSAAERYDFILNTTQPIGNYWIQAKLIGNGCAVANLTQVAILHYIGSKLIEPRTARPVSSDLNLSLGIVLNPLNQVCDNSTTICFHDVHSAEAMDKRILAKKADINIYLPISFHFFTPQELYVPHTYENFETPTGNSDLASMLSNISNVFPPSPYISQLDDIPAGTICNYYNKPSTCNSSEPCYCSHLIPSIPRDALVEIIVADEANIGLNHPFHLHGYGYHVMAQGNLSRVNITRENRYEALQLHAKAYGGLNPLPPIKDTMSVASNGYIILRFIADNPGYWLFHCHFRSHQLSGMEITLHVGQPKDLLPVPPGFPKCGNFIPNP